MIKLLLTISVMLCLSVAYAQEQQYFIPQKKEYYQIFLETPVQKVNKVEYYDEGGALEFKLSPDGKAIHLLDYNGEGGVKAEVVNMDGAVEELIRSKCKIHSLQEL